MNRDISFIKNLTKDAGKLLLKYYKSYNNVINKSEIDIVLTADLEVEKMIISSIKRNFPKDSILAEESGEENHNSDYKWIIDPLDGTMNFNHLFSNFCTTIALSFKGEIIISCAYNPISDELFYAEKDKGSFINDIRISVSKQSDLKKFLVAYATSNHKDQVIINKGVKAHYNVLSNCSAVRLGGSSILDLCRLSQGVFDGLFKLKASYWDYASGILILKEAGGKITNWEGKEEFGQDEYICASNGLQHQKFLEIVTENNL